MISFKKLEKLNKSELIKVIYKKLDKINYLNKTIYAHMANGNIKTFNYYKRLYQKDLIEFIDKFFYMIMSRYNKPQEIKNIYCNDVLNPETIKTLNKDDLIEFIWYLEDYSHDIVSDMIDYRDNKKIK